MSKITRSADTDEQEESLRLVEEWCNRNDIKIRFGTKIGKYPQSVILDIGYNDNAIYVHPDGSIDIYGEELENLKEEDFVEMIDNGRL